MLYLAFTDAYKKTYSAILTRSQASYTSVENVRLLMFTGFSPGVYMQRILDLSLLRTINGARGQADY